ncbi:hypothetical protein L596_027853 [Steinernema carpocapsae]|uniref:Uncharacterized protein n=1 Tax=Steinernema carpocapsae TaxID=34508 RepID=A0A4U5LWR7_STECR|nr:hypothetical protein L596_027853 [Steinernema carpocapsae]
MNFSIFLQAVVLVVVALAIQARYVYVEPISEAEKRNFDREFMHFGKRSDAAGFDRNFMNFGKRSGNEFDRQFMHFGKRTSYEDLMDIDKKNFDRDFMHFGKRSSDDAFQREFMSFGRRR